ncbi:hypothetical protein L1887_61633 [Cichorium endivia]|nr:hypothetical protein L1887_61633 [Cichorium endivia]
MEARLHPVAYGSAIDAACVRGRAERLYEEDVGCGWCGQLTLVPEAPTPSPPSLPLIDAWLASCNLDILRQPLADRIAKRTRHSPEPLARETSKIWATLNVHGPRAQAASQALAPRRCAALVGASLAVATRSASAVRRTSGRGSERCPATVLVAAVAPPGCAVVVAPAVVVAIVVVGIRPLAGAARVTAADIAVDARIVGLVVVVVARPAAHAAGGTLLRAIVVVLLRIVVGRVHGARRLVVVVVVVLAARALEPPSEREHHEAKEDWRQRSHLHPDGRAKLGSARVERTRALEAARLVAGEDEEHELDDKRCHGEKRSPERRQRPQERVGAQVQESRTGGKTGEARRDGLHNERVRKLVDKEAADGVLDAVERLLVAEARGRALRQIALLEALRPDAEGDAQDGVALRGIGEVDVEEVDALDVGQAERHEQLEDERSADG